MPKLTVFWFTHQKYTAFFIYANLFLILVNCIENAKENINYAGKITK